jgi:hypothetical protein
MPEILAVEMSALLLALLSVGAADFFYHSGRIGRPLHSLWVALSIAAMCLPILVWLAGVLIGPGLPAWGTVALIEAALFFGLLHGLATVPTSRRFDPGLPPTARQPQPPAGH